MRAHRWNCFDFISSFFLFHLFQWVYEPGTAMLRSFSVFQTNAKSNARNAKCVKTKHVSFDFWTHFSIILCVGIRTHGGIEWVRTFGKNSIFSMQYDRKKLTVNPDWRFASFCCFIRLLAPRRSRIQSNEEKINTKNRIVGVSIRHSCVARTLRCGEVVSAHTYAH